MTKISVRDKIRSATVGAKKRFSSEIVDVCGVKIEVRQLSLKDRKAIIPDSMDDANNIKWDILGFISSCYVPGTDDQVFDETDTDAIVNGPPGYFDTIYKAITRVNSLSVEDAKKN